MTRADAPICALLSHIGPAICNTQEMINILLSQHKPLSLNSFPRKIIMKILFLFKSIGGWKNSHKR